MATEESSSVSGGLLVVLGIVVALGAVIFFTNYAGRSSGPDISIHADIPNPAKAE